LAELKLQQGDVVSARDLLSRAVELSPHDAGLVARLHALDRR
jgi:hypothetical protein